MNIWKAILAALVIFAAGAVTGSLAVKLLQDQPRVQNNRPDRPDFGQNRRRDYLSRLDRELQLTPGQHQRIEKILSESQDRMRKLWLTIDPKAKEDIKITHERIREVLTPDQQQRFEELSRFHGRRKLGEPGGGSPSREWPRRRSGASENSSNAAPLVSLPDGTHAASTNGK